MTSRVPLPAGLVQVTWVPSPFTLTLVAGVPPKLTPVAPVRLAPVMVTEVPPRRLPAVGSTPVTVGGDANVVSEISSSPKSFP